jgi:type I restriction enzyme, S subunit
MSSDWHAYKLEEVLDALIDYRGKTPRKTDSGIPLITAKIIKGGRIERATEFIAASEYEAWMRRGMPKKDDVVLTVEAPLGEVAQLGPEKIALAQRVVTLRGKAEVLDSTYLLYLLQSSDVQELLQQRASGSTVLGIKQSELRRLPISIPDFDYQVRVAGVLKSLDKSADTFRKQNAAIDAIAKTLYRSWFVNFDPVHAKASGAAAPEGMSEQTAALFPSAFKTSEGATLPKGWKAGKLSTLCDLNPESWSASRHPAVVKYIDLASLKENVLLAKERYAFADAPSRARRALRKGDSLYGTVRPGNLSFGYIGDNEEGLTGSTGFAVLRPKSKSLAEFVYCAMTMKENIERLTHLAEGAAYPAVRPGLVHEQDIVIPPESVLEAFHRVTEPLFEASSLNCRLISAHEDLRNHLLPRLISGKLSLQEAEEALAEAEAI